MTSKNAGRSARRIIIGLRPLLSAEASIATATTLAVALEADVVGLFIQEDELMNLAALPFARTLSEAGRPATPMTPELMLAEFDRLANRWQRVLSSQAQKARVKWSFSTHTGKLLRTIQSALVDGDYLVVSCDGSRFEVRQLLELIGAMPTGLEGIVVVPNNLAKSQQSPVVALIDSEIEFQQMLAFAVRLAEFENSPLDLFIIASNDAEASQLEVEARNLIPSNLSVTHYRFMYRASEYIAAALHERRPAHVVANLENSLFQTVNSLASLFRAANASLILI